MIKQIHFSHVLYNYHSRSRTNDSTNLNLSYLMNKILKGFEEGFLSRLILTGLHLTQ